MAIEWDDGKGGKGTIKCPNLLVEAMRLRHLGEFTGRASEVEDKETDCIGGQCGSFAHCTGRVAVDIHEPDWPIIVTVEPDSETVVEMVDMSTHFKKKQRCDCCGRMVYVCKSGKMVDHRLGKDGRGKKFCPNTSYSIVQ